MAIDAFAIVATLLVGCAEALALTNLRHASICLSVAHVLLLLAFRVAYLIVFIVLSVLAGCAVLLSRLSRHDFVGSFRGATFLGTQAPRWIAGLFHLFGIWYLPVCVVWGVLDVYDGAEGYFTRREFYSEELGHQLASLYLHDVIYHYASVVDAGRL